MADIRRTSSSSSRPLGPGGRVGSAIPIGIPPVLKRFWEFTKKMAHEFARQLKNGEEKEANLIKEVTKRF